MTHPTVTSRGTAAVGATPDHAVWTLVVSCLAASMGEALADVATRGQQLTALLDDLDIPREARATSGVDVVEEFDYVEGKQQRRGFRATVETAVRLDEASTASTLVGEAVDRCDAGVRGPEWTVAPENPARGVACRLAAGEAQRKALAYAEALGLRLGSVVEVRDAESVPPAPRPTGMVKAVAYESTLDITPGQQQVVASVDVTFRLEG